MRHLKLRKLFKQSGAAALIAGAVFGADAEAFELPSIFNSQKTNFNDSVFLQYGDRWVGNTVGHVEYCKRNPDDCKLHSFNSQAISTHMLDVLKDANVKINGMVTPMDDPVLYPDEGGDYWTIPAVAEDGRLLGDCEDYALLKRRIFHEDHGVPMNAMSIVFVVISESVSLPPGTNRQHAILLVRMEDGDYIFDNLNNEVLRPWETPYEYYGATAFDNFRVWRVVAQRHPQQLHPSYEAPALLVYNPPQDSPPAAAAVAAKDIPIPRIRPNYSQADMMVLTPQGLW